MTNISSNGDGAEKAIRILLSSLLLSTWSLHSSSIEDWISLLIGPHGKFLVLSNSQVYQQLKSDIGKNKLP